jgi:hypothetical protein
VAGDIPQDGNAIITLNNLHLGIEREVPMPLQSLVNWQVEIAAYYQAKYLANDHQ